MVEEQRKEDNKETVILKEIKEFRDNKVWVTKKIRMDAEARMNKNNLFSLIIVNYYTLIVLSLSIWALVIESKYMVDKISLITVISSVALFGISLFVSVFGFKEKAISYKQCYLDLYRLENQFDEILLDDSLDHSKALNKFNELKKDYNHILEKTDNHSDEDRLYFLKKQKN
ncbi:SLATT domain-containing protein [Peribacillus frigoritolerans]|uniref:SLATT domain-containing protein n=1 Tax=Peribacillus frigoritolerans TaxID=450367 RepID=UPI003D00DE66